MARLVGPLRARRAAAVDLAKLTFTDESTTSRTVSSLVEKRLVARRRSTRSSREVNVKLSLSGGALVTQHISTVLDHERIIVRGLTAAEVRTLRRFLVQMRANMETFIADRSLTKKKLWRGWVGAPPRTSENRP